MTIVYIIVCHEDQRFADMACVSAISARITNPNTPITIICDAITLVNLEATKHRILSIADTCIPVESPSGNGTFIHRWLKTQMNKWTSTECLFLDADTLVRRPLRDLPGMVHDLGAVPNYNTDVAAEQIWDEDQKELDQMKWPARFYFYLNSGVLFYRRTKHVEKWFSLWHELWLQSSQRIGRFRDQPSCNAAIIKSGVPLARLPDCFNFQLHHIVKGWSGAAIWHYYSSVSMQATCFEHIVKQVPELSESTLKEMVASAVSAAHPFMAQDELAQAIADYADQNGILSTLRKSWLKAGSVQEKLTLISQSEKATDSLVETTNKLNSVYQSMSWRITRPARVVEKLFRGKGWQSDP